MKDKEWLKDKIKDEESSLKCTYDNYVSYEKVLIADDVYDLIDQLDEPEVTLDRAFEKVAESYSMTKEEIWRHLEWLEVHGGKVTFRESEVLSQELPVIPQFVADFIEKWKSEGLTMSEWFTFDYDNEEDDEVAKWLYDNDYAENTRREYLLIDAVRYGYEVEKEKRYYIINKEANATLTTFELSDVVGEEIIEFVYSYSENETIHFDSKEKAELIAHFVGDFVEVMEVTE